MEKFMSLFEHRGMYMLPDNTPVRALLYNLECLSLEWLFEDLSGIRKVAVLPNGDVIAYAISGRDQYGYLYSIWRTDMTIDDIRPAA